MALEAWYPYVATVALFLAAGYFTHRLRDSTDQFRTFSPIALYMVLVGLYFAFSGWSTFATTSCPAVDCTDLSSALAVMLGAAFVARYPLRDVWPSADNWVFLGLAWGAIVVGILVAMIAPDLLLPLAYGFGAVVVGVATVGYVGLKVARGGLLELGSTNVAALALVLTASVPLAGAAVDAPALSALLSPVPLAAVHVFFDRVALDDDGASDVDAEAAT